MKPISTTNFSGQEISLRKLYTERLNAYMLFLAFGFFSLCYFIGNFNNRTNFKLPVIITFFPRKIVSIIFHALNVLERAII